MKNFTVSLIEWCKGEETITGVALVGSYARGEERPDSDVDLVILCRRPELLLKEQGWITRFGKVREVFEEDYGALVSVRVFYVDGFEIEFGITEERWAATPMDAGTRQVMQGGFQVVYDPGGQLENLRNSFMRCE